MVKILLLDHLKLQIQERNIDENLVKDVVSNPDSIVQSTKERMIAQKIYFDKLVNKEYLIRVIFREENACKKVVTAYKTSKIKKYVR